MKTNIVLFGVLIASITAMYPAMGNQPGAAEYAKSNLCFWGTIALVVAFISLTMRNADAVHLYFYNLRKKSRKNKEE